MSKKVNEAIWGYRPLGDFVDIQGGYAFKSNDAAEEGIRWLKISNVSIGDIIWDNKAYLPYEYADRYNEYLLMEGDYVIALTRPIIRNQLKIGQIKLEDTPALLNQRVGRIRSYKNVDEKFIYYVMSSSYYVQEINNRILGTDPPNVNPKQLEAILVDMPPLKEQQKIAEILSSVDAAIEKTEQVIAKTEEVKKGLIQQLPHKDIITTLLNISKKIEIDQVKCNKLKQIKQGLTQQLLTGQVRVKV